MTVSRRIVVGALGIGSVLPAWAAKKNPSLFAALETKSGGRLGVAILDTRTGRVTGHRLDERFGMCSTFKLPLAAVVLNEIDVRRLKPDTVLAYKDADLAPNSPVAKANLAKGGMTVLDCAKAAQQVSDNTAANLLLRQLGGPAGFTAKLRALGDPATRLDRDEPMMNLVLPGEMHDTTTPRGMATGMRSYLLGGALTAGSRATLIDWMIETKTGARRIRAGLPAGWRAGDKTGSSWDWVPMVDKIHDVAIVWPPRRSPVIVVAYLEGATISKGVRPEDEAILAQVGRIVAQDFA